MSPLPMRIRSASFLAVHHRNVGVELKDRRGDRGRDRSEERLFENFLLRLAVGNEQDLLCLQDRNHSHRNGLLRDLVYTVEEARIRLDRRLVQIDHVRVLDENVGRLVESDVSVQTDPEQLQIDPAQAIDPRVVLGALARKVRRASVGNKGVLTTDVDVIEKVFLHKITVALRVILTQPNVFVQIDRDRLAEVNVALVVPLDELTVNANGRGPRRKTQHTVRLHDDLRRDDVCRLTAELAVIFDCNEFHSIPPSFYMFYLLTVLFLFRRRAVRRG